MKNPIEMLKAIMLFLTIQVKAEWAKFKAWYIKNWMPVVYRFMLGFWINTKAKGGGGKGGGTTGKIGDWIGLTISLIFGVYLLPVIVDAVGGTDFTGWNFTGAAGAKVLYLLLPFIFVVGMIVYFIGRLLGKI
jgi:hypothetical protein